MAVATRLIRRRIASIRNTRKITKAMELVSASKMRRSVQIAVSSRAFAETARQLVHEVMRRVDPATHTFLSGTFTDGVARNGAKTIVVVVSSDRGLCGGFNAQALKKSIEFIKTREGEELEIVSIGGRAERALRKTGIPITASFEAISNAPSFARTVPISRLLTDAFRSGAARRIFIVFTRFEGALKQIPTVEQLFPIIPEAFLDTGKAHGNDEIQFEPDPSAVLDRLLPRIVETRIYQALLESAASEHSARMMAMRSATDNASAMLADLTLMFNTARQAGITQEISEISAGKAAIE